MQPANDRYPILDIESDSVLDAEAMGSKDKFWFQRPGDTERWLFKYPKLNTGLHWAEKLAAEIAEELETLHAKVELAQFGTSRGSATESFAREGRELYHGNQVLAGQVTGYDATKRFGQSNHTLVNIFAALDRIYKRTETAMAAKERIASYLVLDGLIGNTDRHHENWGILVKRTPSGRSGMIAPSFDHASSLGRELVDVSTGRCRTRILSEGLIGQYCEKAPGAIYWQPGDKRGVSPLELVRRAVELHPALFRRSLTMLDKVNRRRLESIIDRVPADWMSEAARRFAIELLCYNLNELLKIPR
jgi:hypothetical protein